MHKFSSLCFLRVVVGASGAPISLGESEDLEQRDLGRWLCLNSTKGRGGETGGQRDLSMRQEQQEPHDAEQCKTVQVGQPSLHTGMCSLGLAGHQLCRRGSVLPWLINEFPVHLCSSEGK